MQAANALSPSSPSSSPPTHLDAADAAKSVTVVDDEQQDKDARRGAEANDSSPASSPLTPSTGRSLNDAPPSRRGAQASHISQDGTSTFGIAQSGQPEASLPSCEPGPTAQPPPPPVRVIRLNLMPTTTTNTAAPGATGVRVSHTLRLPPSSSSYSGGKGSMPAAPTSPTPPVDGEDAPPAKRLRLSLTTTAAAPTAASSASRNTPNDATNGHTVSASVNGEGGQRRERRVLRLIPPRLTPAVAADNEEALGIRPDCREKNTVRDPVLPHNEEHEQAQLLSQAVETRHQSEAPLEDDSPRENSASAQLKAQKNTSNPEDEADARGVRVDSARPAEQLPFSESGARRPPPISTTPPALQQQQQQELKGPQQQQADLTASLSCATVGSPSGAQAAIRGAATTPASAVDSGPAFPRLRSLTPQPYGAGTPGSPRRRHRFVNVTLPPVPPPPQNELFTSFQRTVRDVYDVHEKLSEGTYGEVFKGVDKRTGALVALKRLKMLSTHQGFPQTSLREVIALRHIQSQRERLEARQRQSSGMAASAAVADPLAEVAQLCDVLVFDRQQPDIVLVFAYATASLAGLLRRQFAFSPAELAYLVKKIFVAVRKLHEMSIIHRDIKSDNVLITGEGEVQLTDFGLCSIVGCSGTAQAWRTPSVITLAYRPPEMLLGSTAYDEKVDVWSVGCLLAQLYLFEPPFYRRAVQQQQQQQQQQPQRTAATELEQLSRITEVLGPLPPARVFHPESCHHMRVLEQLEQQGRLAESGRADQPANWGRLQSIFTPSFLFQQFHGFRNWFEAELQRTRHQQPHRRPSQACMDVLCAALQLDPQQRPSAAELLRMPYFTTLDDAPLSTTFQRHHAVTPEREEEVRRGFMMKVQRCGDSHTQRRPHG